MASVSKDKNGNRTIQFMPADGSRKRKTIWLGRVRQRTVDTVKKHVEELVAARLAGRSPYDETNAWLGEIGGDMHKKLAAVGLIAPRQPVAPVPEPGGPKLANFLDSYIAERSDVKRSTATVYGHTRRCLVEYFGANKLLADITLADADDWRRWLTRPKNEDKPAEGGQGLSDNTARRRCGIAKQFFRAAVRRRLITENPFTDMKGVSVLANRARDYFVSRAETAKVLGACPDAQWQLLFALSRYGGLRCPSEHLALTWGDVNWERERITVRSPKTAHHEGHEERVMPLFPELRPYLQAALDELLDDFDPKEKRLSEQPVITRYRDRNANLRTQLLRIIRKAGLSAWPKLFQNLRSTRETELAETFPIHVVCDWIGNSQAVAAKHYLQTTDEHFAAASGAGNLQNPVQSGAVTPRDKPSEQKGPRAITGVYKASRLLTICTVGDEGLEPPTFAV